MTVSRHFPQGGACAAVISGFLGCNILQLSVRSVRLAFGIFPRKYLLAALNQFGLALLRQRDECLAVFVNHRMMFWAQRKAKLVRSPHPSAMPPFLTMMPSRVIPAENAASGDSAVNELPLCVRPLAALGFALLLDYSAHGTFISIPSFAHHARLYSHKLVMRFLLICDVLSFRFTNSPSRPGTISEPSLVAVA